MWGITLRKLYAIRQELMTGLGNEEIRHAIWEKQYWTASDESSDQKLHFDEVEKLCRRLNVNTSTEELKRLFQVEKFHFSSHKSLQLRSKQTRSARVFSTSLTFSVSSNCSRLAQISPCCTRNYAAATTGDLILVSLNILCITFRRHVLRFDLVLRN